MPAEGGALAGRDALVPTGRRKRGDLPFTLRFHLHPAVTASEPDGPRIVLVLPQGAAWLFEIEDAATLTVEDSIFFASPGGARRCRQIVVQSHTAQGAELRWRFTRLGGDGAPAAVE